ncbi:MAG TPA: hypothetical protein VF773_11855 [Verrucomicrobiae bacterium]
MVGGAPVTLQDISAEVEVFYSAMRYNRAQNVWNFEVTIANRTTRDLTGAMVLYVESFNGTTGVLNADATDGTHAYFGMALSIPGGTRSRVCSARFLAGAVAG